MTGSDQQIRLRRGVSMLAAAAVVAGGLTVGSGTAVAEAGSADFLPAFVGLVPMLAAGSVDAELPYCDPRYTRAVREFEGITANNDVKATAYPGELIQSTINIESVDNARSVERVTAYLPAGSSLASIDVSSYDPVNRWWNRWPDPATSVDKKTGAVTVTGSWPVPTRVIVEYIVPVTARIGSVLSGGFGVTVTGLAPRDWPALSENSTTVGDWCEYEPEPVTPMPGGGSSAS